jgi:hypothetical protein
MPEFMSEEEAVGLAERVEHDASWEPTEVVKSSRGYRLVIRHRETGRKRLVNNLAQWHTLVGHLGTTTAISAPERFQENAQAKRPGITSRVRGIGGFILYGCIVPSLVLLAIAGPFAWPGWGALLLPACLLLAGSILKWGPLA